MIQASGPDEPSASNGSPLGSRGLDESVQRGFEGVDLPGQADQVQTVHAHGDQVGVLLGAGDLAEVTQPLNDINQPLDRRLGAS